MINWPELKFPPINLWSMPKKIDFYYNVLQLDTDV
jgi:hypothetical protein